MSTESEEIKEDNYKISDNAIKNVTDILNTDAEDESLRKYKLNLLKNAINGDIGDKNDSRKLIIIELRVIFDESENKSDIIFDKLDTKEGVLNLQNKGIILKENCKYKFQLSFKVQHEIISGIKFIHKIKKAIFNDTEEIVIGSFAPGSNINTFTFPKYGYNEAPGGIFFRGKYNIIDIYLDSDKFKHLEFEYFVDIKKEWD